MEAALRKMDATAVVRCWRRSRNSTRPRSGPLSALPLVLATNRLISRWAATRSTSAISRIHPIRSTRSAGPAKYTR